MRVFYVAAFAKSSNQGWFSLGRQRKVDQVMSMLRGLGHQVIGLNIAPHDADISFPNTLSLCQSKNVLIRYLQIFFSSFRFFYFLSRRHPASILWLYNTRAAESVVAIVCLFLFPSFRLVLQLEDLPSARQENHNLAGWVDGLSTSFLSRRSSLVFAVSHNVAKEYSRLTATQESLVRILSPALHPTYLEVIDSRLKPFTESQLSILYAGSYQSDKGVLDLIEAFLRLEPGLFRLYLVGSSPAPLRDMYSGEPDIFFAGVLSDFDLFIHYSKADIIVNPHRPILNSNYVFPFKLVEIFASGALPLSTPVPGIELFSPPKECIFSGVNQLAYALSQSRSIWEANSNKIELIAEQCRVDYSFEVTQLNLKRNLSKLFHSST